MGVLANENHERYARLRAILVPPRAAVLSIGLKVTSGTATKLEQNPKIRARIAELVADEEEDLRAKRAQLEWGLNAIAYGDGSEFPGKRMTPKYPDRLHAMGRIQDMHGFKAPSKSEITGKDGSPFVPVSDEQREKALLAFWARRGVGSETPPDEA